MTNEQAKFVLHAYRANGADAADPTFQEALEQTRRDPALEKWFAAQQTFDRVLCAKLGEITPASGLREAILAGADLSRVGAPTTARAWWRSRGFMAIAASLALLAAITVALWPKEAAAQVALINFAMEDVARDSHRDGHGGDTAQLRELLASAETRLRGGLPLDFERLREGGCRTVDFHGRELLEVCFKRDGNWFHCYVARVEDFPGIARKLDPAFGERAGLSAGVWSDGRHIFIVASNAGREAIRRLI